MISRGCQICLGLSRPLYILFPVQALLMLSAEKIIMAFPKSERLVKIEQAFIEESIKQWERGIISREYSAEREDIRRLVNEAQNGLLESKNIPSWPFLYLGNALTDLVGILEYLMRSIILNDKICDPTLRNKYYDSKSGTFRNFQFYPAIRNMLCEVIKLDLDKSLEPKEREWLQYFLQLRHIIIHNNSHADKPFIENTSNFMHIKPHQYKIGEKVLVESEHIRILLIILDKVFNIIDEKLSQKDQSFDQIVQSVS